MRYYGNLRRLYCRGLQNINGIQGNASREVLTLVLIEQLWSRLAGPKSAALHSVKSYLQPIWDQLVLHKYKTARIFVPINCTTLLVSKLPTPVTKTFLISNWTKYNFNLSAGSKIQSLNGCFSSISRPTK